METSLFIGRYQPWHEGHATLVRVVLDEGKKAVIALRDTEISPENPYTAADRKAVIEAYYKGTKYENMVQVIIIPDITDVCYGRKVGWGIRQIHLDEKIESISATKIRAGQEC